jgi:hypothetical protein
MGIGVDPVTDTAAAVSSAPWWATMVSGIIGTLGTAYIVAKVGEAPGETNLPPDGTGDGSNNQNNQPGTGSMLLPILLVGGAAAAYFILKPSKK